MLGGRGKILECGSLGAGAGGRGHGVLRGGRDEDRGGLAPAKGRVLDLAEALEAAHGVAEEGDTVLLGPACASFDEFGSLRRGASFRAFESCGGRKRKM